jgi:molybdate transport system ATP-binding protein
MIAVEAKKRLGDFSLDVHFSAPSTGVIALYGRSGAGKTSVVNMLAGLIRPDEGRISIDDAVLFSSQERIDLPPERRRLGYVFQEGRLFPHYSVRGNLRYGAPRRPRQGLVTFDGVVSLLALAPLLDRPVAALSGGEKQRVAIGRALLAEPRLLLMDEPLASLDAARKGEILPFIERLRDELRLPIIYVSHAMAEIVRLADTLVVVAEGKIAASGALEAVTSQLALAPLTGLADAGAVIRTTLAGHDRTFGLSELAFPGGRLRVSHIALPLGTALRVRIRARDVALATTRPTGISIRNVFPARIVEMARASGPLRDVRLDIGTAEQPVALWARITQRAAQELGLEVGRSVFALLKAVALDRGSYGQFEASEGNFRDDEAS